MPGGRQRVHRCCARHSLEPHDGKSGLVSNCLKEDLMDSVRKCRATHARLEMRVGFPKSSTCISGRVWYSACIHILMIFLQASMS